MCSGCQPSVLYLSLIYNGQDHALPSKPLHEYDHLHYVTDDIVVSLNSRFTAVVTVGNAAGNTSSYRTNLSEY